MTKSTKADAIARLQRARSKIAQLRELNRKSPEYIKWCRNTKIAIKNTFTDSEQHLKEFRQSLIVWTGVSPFDESERARRQKDQSAYFEGLTNADALLESMISEVRDYWDDPNEADKDPLVSETEAGASNDKVFVVHGRDIGTKNTVARFLENTGLQPVILAEKPAKGRTIIEKFEQYSRVRFAIVLLTADDVGSLKGDDNDPTPRPRQNVIFEFGFFVGRLGREGVCALTSGNVEIPSDYAGVEYIDFDESEGWKRKVLREMKTAGLYIDPERALGA